MSYQRLAFSCQPRAFIIHLSECFGIHNYYNNCSLISQRHHRIDLGRPARRDVVSEQGNRSQ